MPFPDNQAGTLLVSSTLVEPDEGVSVAGLSLSTSIRSVSTLLSWSSAAGVGTESDLASFALSIFIERVSGLESILPSVVAVLVGFNMAGGTSVEAALLMDVVGAAEACERGDTVGKAGESSGGSVGTDGGKV